MLIGPRQRRMRAFIQNQALIGYLKRPKPLIFANALRHAILRPYRCDADNAEFLAILENWVTQIVKTIVPRCWVYSPQ